MLGRRDAGTAIGRVALTALLLLPGVEVGVGVVRRDGGRAMGGSSEWEPSDRAGARLPTMALALALAAVRCELLAPRLKGGTRLDAPPVRGGGRGVAGGTGDPTTPLSPRARRAAAASSTSRADGARIKVRSGDPGAARLKLAGRSTDPRGEVSDDGIPDPLSLLGGSGEGPSGSGASHDVVPSAV